MDWMALGGMLLWAVALVGLVGLIVLLLPWLVMLVVAGVGTLVAVCAVSWLARPDPRYYIGARPSRDRNG